MDDAGVRRQQEIFEFLMSKGFRADPVCGKELIDLRTGEVVLNPDTDTIWFTAYREFAFFFADERTSGIGLIPILCLNCGHVMWFSPAVMFNREDGP